MRLRPDPFFNRQAELSTLERAWSHPGGGQMMMVYGRRRLGKTYLLQRFFYRGDATGDEPKYCCYYLAEQSSAELQRLALAARLLEAFPAARVSPEDIAVSW